MAVTSTVVFFAVIVVVIVTSAGWPEVRKAFFDRKIFSDSFPEIAHAFLLNIRIFITAEALILIFALAIAVLRGLPGRCSSRSGCSQCSTPTSFEGSRRSS
jgi:polar amino acid transport system permease protein